MSETNKDRLLYARKQLSISKEELRKCETAKMFILSDIRHWSRRIEILSARENENESCGKCKK